MNLVKANKKDERCQKFDFPRLCMFRTRKLKKNFSSDQKSWSKNFDMFIARIEWVFVDDFLYCFMAVDDAFKR